MFSHWNPSLVCVLNNHGLDGQTCGYTVCLMAIHLWKFNHNSLYVFFLSYVLFFPKIKPFEHGSKQLDYLYLVWNSTYCVLTISHHFPWYSPSPALGCRVWQGFPWYSPSPALGYRVWQGLHRWLLAPTVIMGFSCSLLHSKIFGLPWDSNCHQQDVTTIVASHWNVNKPLFTILQRFRLSHHDGIKGWGGDQGTLMS